MTIEKLTDEQWERIRNGHADEDDGIAAVSLIDSLTAKAEAQAAALADKALVLERYAAQASALDRVRAVLAGPAPGSYSALRAIREAIAAAPEHTAEKGTDESQREVCMVRPVGGRVLGPQAASSVRVPAAHAAGDIPSLAAPEHTAPECPVHGEECLGLGDDCQPLAAALATAPEHTAPSFYPFCSQEALNAYAEYEQVPARPGPTAGRLLQELGLSQDVEEGRDPMDAVRSVVSDLAAANARVAELEGQCLQYQGELLDLMRQRDAANARVAELGETAQSMREKMARRAEKTELLVKQCHQLKSRAMIVLRKYKDTDEDVRRLLDDDWEDP